MHSRGSGRVPGERFRARGPRRAALVLACLSLSLGAATRGAAAQPERVLRMATIAPEGSSWARSFRVFEQHIERGTDGKVEVKLYLGGVAGDERGMAQRVAQGQLDGVLSSGIMCADVMPSMRVTRIPGVFQSRDEALHVVSELAVTLSEEARGAGFRLLGTAGVGSSVIFTREPIHSMEDLRRVRFWRWRYDDVAVEANRKMGLEVIPLGLSEGAKAFDEGRIDGFYAVPTATLVFQWHTQAKYMMDLWGDYLVGCFLVTEKAYDALSVEQQKVLDEAGVMLALRFEESGRQLDARLLGGIFQRHGVKALSVSPKLRAEFYRSARQARQHLGEKLVPDALLNRVLRLLADYRAEHGGTP